MIPNIITFPENFWFAAASVTSLVIALLHYFGGGREHHRPMLNAPIREVDKGVWFALWHFVTATLILMAASLWIAAIGQASFALFPLALSLVCTALFFFETLRRFKRLLALPQWILFTLLSLLIGAGFC
ncbi:MAG: hypothetical protein ACK5BE_05035 [Alphaproteobacteria bacterium]|jgi:hypothetical protein